MSDLFVYGRDNPAAYNHFARAQSGCCAICGRAGVLQVDHEHSEMALVRGLLCGPCNIGLGQFRDDLDALRRAIGYLEAHTARNAAYESSDDWQARRVVVSNLANDPEFVKARNQKIRDAAEAGESVGALTLRFKLAKSQVYEIVNGRAA